MSSNVGTEAGFIDTQGIVLENVTDGLIYDQVLKVQPANLDHNMFFHQLTNDTVDKTFSLTNASFEVTMMATQPELAGLLALVAPVSSTLPSREWNITLTDQSNRSTVLGGNATMSSFKIVDGGVGSVTLQFTLNFTSEELVNP